MIMALTLLATAYITHLADVEVAESNVVNGKMRVDNPIL